MTYYNIHNLTYILILLSELLRITVCILVALVEIPMPAVGAWKLGKKAKRFVLAQGRHCQLTLALLSFSQFFLKETTCVKRYTQALETDAALEHYYSE